MMDEKTYNKMVAANLRRLMYEKGVNGTELAKALGFTKQSVYVRIVETCQFTFQIQ